MTRDADAEWRSFCEVLGEAIDCAVDLAIAKVDDAEDDIAALEHLRAIALTRLAGIPVPMRLSEMLQAIGILLDALVDKRDEGAAGCLATPLRRMRDIATVTVSDEQIQREASVRQPVQPPRRRVPSVRIPSPRPRRTGRAVAA